MIVVNFCGQQGFDAVRVRIPQHALGWLGIGQAGEISFEEKLEEEWSAQAAVEELPFGGIPLPPLPALGVLVVELTPARA